jgi:hypothetical protein
MAGSALITENKRRMERSTDIAHQSSHVLWSLCHINPNYCFTVALMTVIRKWAPRWTRHSSRCQRQWYQYSAACKTRVTSFVWLPGEPSVTSCVGNDHDSCTSYCGLVNDMLVWLIANISVLYGSHRAIISKIFSRRGAYSPFRVDHPDPVKL